MKKLILLTLFILCFLSAAEVKPEYRAMWVTRYEMTSSENISEIIASAVSNNFNALFIQVCGRGTSFYNSSILPKDSSVPTFDPLADIIIKAKKNNIEVHAWVNALYVWSNAEKPAAASHVVNAHHSWLLNYDQNNNNNSYFLNPALTEVREHIAAVCLEIAKKYPVAGIHLDYIRLPGKKYSDFDTVASKIFEKQNGVNPKALLKNKEIAQRMYGTEEYQNYLTKWHQFNRDNVSAIVKDISQTLAKTKPECILSAAVIADNEQAYNDYFQDWPEWIAKGYIDMVIPMAYSTKEDLVRKQIVFTTQLAEKYDCTVLIGLGAWQLKPENTIKHIRFTQKIREKMGFSQLAGVVLFSYDKIKENNYLDKIHRKVFSQYANRPELNIIKKKLVEQQNNNLKNQENGEIDLKYHNNIIG